MTRKESSLRNKVALVTGGSSGIGKAIVQELASAGSKVAFLYKSESLRTVRQAAQVVALGKKIGRTVVALAVDVADFEAVQQTVATIRKKFGRLDILVNNAGITRDSVIWKMDERHWDEVLTVNLKGYFNCIRAVAPLFRQQGSGTIVNITSINGLRGKFGQANYAASKAGVIGLTKTVARELGSSGVTVNAVAPGMILTPLTRRLPQEILNLARNETVLGRLGRPEDVAYLVRFLCSPQARHITGTVIKIDGGQYI